MIVIIGADGMLGRYLCNFFGEKCLPITRKEYDIEKDDANNLVHYIAGASVVINCAGVIPQRCDVSDIEKYNLINGKFPHTLYNICKQYNAKMIQITTECVFDGTKGNYIESDMATCKDIYGITKYIGEPKDACVIRTSFVGREFLNRKSLLEWVLSQNGKTINGFTNCFWNGVTCLQLAKIIGRIINEKLYWRGVRHIFSPNIVSKYELIKNIISVFNLDITLKEYELSQSVDKTLTTMYTDIDWEIPPIYEQLVELRQHYDKQFKIQCFSNTLDDKELAAVKRVFDSKWLFMGNECQKFEQEFAEKINSKHVLFTNGCTNSMHMCLQVLNIGPGDQVIMPTISFMSCASSVQLLGATPVFCDVDDNLNISPTSLKNVITENTKAIIVLHYGGVPCDMDEILKIAQDIPIIEDAANSPYSLYKGRVCGTLGTFGCYSFDAMKIMCAGEAGAISVNDEKYIDKLYNLRFLGLPRTGKSGEERSKTSRIWWQVALECPSIKYNSCDITAAITREQLLKLPKFLDKRALLMQTYDELLKDIDGITVYPRPNYDYTSCNYFYWIIVDNNKRDDLINHLKNQDIYCTVKYWPLHKIDIFNDGKTYKNAERLVDSIINLPMHQNMSILDVRYIAKTIDTYLNSNK